MKYSFCLYSAISDISLYDIPFNISSVKITKFFCKVNTPIKFILVDISGLSKNIHITNSTAYYCVTAFQMGNVTDNAVNFISENAKTDCIFSPAVQLSSFTITLSCDDGNIGVRSLNEVQQFNNAFIEIEIL